MNTEQPGVDARNLSCQALTALDPDTLLWHGQPVEGYAQEMDRRGEDHVHSCSLIGHGLATAKFEGEFV